MDTKTKTSRRGTTAAHRKRSSSAEQRRFARGTAASPRRSPLHRKRQPKPSGVKGLIGGLLPAAGKKATPSSNKAKLGGLGAALAAGAGLAFKNRKKLGELRHGNRDGSSTPVEPAVPRP